MSNAAAPKSNRLPIWVGAAIIAALLAWGGWSRHVTTWSPDRAAWPVQGVAVGAANDPVDWDALKRAGASFAYIDERGPNGVNRGMDRQIAAARAAGLRTGVTYRFSLCPSWNQSAEFVTRVARDPAMLPPVIALTADEGCDRLPTRAAILSELSTFLTQVETHVGMAAIIAPDAAFEASFAVREGIDRQVMAPPGSGNDGPEGDWALWQANGAFDSAASDSAMRWLVARDGGFVTEGSGDDAR